VGAAYCAGLQIPQLRALALAANWQAFSRPVWPRRGLVSFDRLEPWMEDQLGVLDIRDLAIPFAPVATDLVSGERVILRRGRLATAVRASCSVPGVVTPVEIEGRMLGDGGISDNLPVDAARALGADYVIGVDLFVPGYLNGWGPLAAGAFALETLVRHAGGGLHQADYLITPELSGKTYFRFSKCRELMAIGEAAAEMALPHIRQALAL
jgi:NTE family protein